jgi:RNA polymerase sigma factor (sigma-70 family)
MPSNASPAARRSGAARPFRSAPKDKAPAVNPFSGGLSPSRERELAARIIAGDQKARDELVTGNMALCYYYAIRFLQWGWHDLEKEDLAQEGSLGLIRAAEKYDPATHGTRFSTYASYWVRSRIRLAILNRGELIRIPVHRHDKQEASSLRGSVRRLDREGVDIPDRSEDRLAALVDAEDRLRLRKAISRLFPEQRELIRWYLEDSEHSRASKKSRQQRADAVLHILASIRKRLNPEGSTNE